MNDRRRDHRNPPSTSDLFASLDAAYNESPPPTEPWWVFRPTELMFWLFVPLFFALAAVSLYTTQFGQAFDFGVIAWLIASARWYREDREA